MMRNLAAVIKLIQTIRISTALPLLLIICCGYLYLLWLKPNRLHAEVGGKLVGPPPYILNK